MLQAKDWESLGHSLLNLFCFPDINGEASLTWDYLPMHVYEDIKGYLFDATRRICDSSLDGPNLLDSLRFLYEDERARGRSLTAKQVPENQIRFFTQHRIREFVRQTFKNRVPDYVTRNAVECVPDDPAFSIFSWCQEARWVILNSKNPFGHDELRILTSNVDELEERIDVGLTHGDSWTPMFVGKLHLASNVPISPKLAAMYGMASTLSGNPFLSMYFYEMRAIEGGLERARALYSMAMNETKHFPSQFQSPVRALRLLDDAFEILENSISSPQIIYEMIFNRNGASLCYYRMGLFEQAREILKKCTRDIEQIGAHELHKTVLYDNLGTVLELSSMLDEAEEAFSQAVELDEYFPEYRFSLAKCQMKRGHYDSAKRNIMRCIEQEPYRSSHYWLLAEIEDLLGSESLSLNAYKKMFELGETDANALYNFCVQILKSDDPSNVESVCRIFDKIDEFSLDRSVFSDYQVLKSVVRNNTAGVAYEN